MRTAVEKTHILIADDEPHTRITLALILKRAGYHVSTAENGRQAFEIISTSQNPDSPVNLLLTDILMPEMSGFELLDKLNENGMKLPVIGITGHGDKTTVVNLMRKGCADYLDKPFEQEDVLQRVAEALVAAAPAPAAGEDDHKHVRIERDAETYRIGFEHLKKQIHVAAAAYKRLTEINLDECAVTAAIISRPLTDMGGDIVDINNTETGCDVFAADVAGHDMGASYHAVLLKNFFKKFSPETADGLSFLSRLNRELIENGRHDRLVTAVFLRFNTREMTCEITSAAHPPVFRLPSDETAPEALYIQGDIIGINRDADFGTQTIRISPGDRFFIYTDGIPNSMSLNTETGIRSKLSGSGLKTLIEKHADKTADQAVDLIIRDTIDFCRGKPRDDLLLIGLEVPG